MATRQLNAMVDAETYNEFTVACKLGKSSITKQVETLMENHTAEIKAADKKKFADKKKELFPSGK